MRAAAFLSRERALGDQARNQVLGAAEVLQPRAVADEAGVVPERSTKLLRHLGFRRWRLRWLDRGRLRLVERRQCGAPAEDEALEQRVRGGAGWGGGGRGGEPPRGAENGPR